MFRHRVWYRLSLTVCLCLVASFLMGGGSGAAEGEMIRWPLPGRLTQLTASGDELYGMISGGVFRMNLQDGSWEQVITDLELEEKYGIQEDYGYFLLEEGLGILDPENGSISLWQAGELTHLADLPADVSVDNRFGVRCVAGQGMLWIAGMDQVYVVELSSGALAATLGSQVVDFRFHPEGMLALLEQDGEWVLKQYSFRGEAGETMASLGKNNPVLLGADAAAGQIYAQVDGIVCRLDQHQWVPVKAMPLPGTWAVWNGHLVASDQEGIVLLPLDGLQERRIVIRGGNDGITGDRAFMAENPGMGIARISQKTTAEDVHTAILSGDGAVDLFCLRMSYGVQALIDKGFASSAGLEEMRMDVERMHPFIQAAVMRDGVLLAYPAYLRTVRCWWQDQEYAQLTPPGTLAQLMDFSREFDGQDHDFPAVANEFRDAPWSRRDYACYALLQWILAHEEDTLRFSDQRLEQLLVNILDMPEVPQGEMANGETRAVFTYSQNATLLPLPGTQAELTRGPAVGEGTEPVYPVELYVFIANPHSTHQEEIQTYLQFVSRSRMPYQLPYLYGDVQAAQIPEYQEKLDDIIQREQAAREALAKAEPEDRREKEEVLESILKDKRALMEGDGQWDYNPLNLAFFQSHYVPRMMAPVSPLITWGGGAYPGLISEMWELVDQYLSGQLSPGECLTLMDQKWEAHRKEMK